MVVGKLHHLCNFFHVHIIAERGAVVHNGGKAERDRLVNAVFGQAVVKVQNHRNRRLLGQRNQHWGQLLQAGKRKQHLCRADDDGRLRLLGCRNNAFRHLKVDGVEQADSILLLLCVLQDFVQCYQHKR